MGRVRTLRGMTITAISAVSLCGVAVAAPPAAADKVVPRAANPYMMITLHPDAPVKRDTTSTQSIVGGYTRLIMTYSPANTAAAARYYRGDRRNDLKRLFFGKSITRVLSLKANVVAPRLSRQVVVASVERQSSNKTGESWTTEFNAERQLTPLFRIDPDSTVGIEASLSLSSSYDTSAARSILEVVRRGAALVAPPTVLVTPFSQKRYDDASGFVDSSIGSLMRESIVERGVNDFALARAADGPLMSITLEMPLGNKITPRLDATDGSAPVALGTWDIRTAPATLSVFSDVLWPNPETRARRAGDGCGGSDLQLRQACAAFARLDPQTVLNFALDENVSVAQALSSEPAIAAARDRLVTGKDKAAAGEAAQSLCALVADKAHRLGFNRYDVAAVTWAYASNSNLSNNGGYLRDPKNCAVLETAYRVGLPKQEFTTAIDDAQG